MDIGTVLKVLKNTLYHVPGHNFRYVVLKELEDYGLIKKIHRMRYQIIDSNCDKLLQEIKPDELKKIINEINKQKKVKCYDESIYKIIPSHCIKKLENLNVWILN
jgi:predicted transcriptional regulator